uniref:Mre11_DNA_bind domain-containing protein n=1 Tax=Rhabditophanes sp. KR3021 TaxID=114890 RepID=A0AC35TIW7_9BILA
MAEDMITIALASDMHVGFGEKKTHRKFDTLNTFEEFFEIAKQYEADAVLLGGDLFHENNPSREMQLEVVRCLRKHCFSSKKCQLEFLSKACDNFDHSKFDNVNYKDQFINVGLPIFTIHGNHDDLSGTGLTALDLLHEAGFLNLFGKFKDIDHININPILLKKGETRIALYGIGSQRDDRLHRAFEIGKVVFNQPKDGHSYFNILVLHQNRPRRNFTRRTGAFIPDKLIPDFFDLIVWGHEHMSIPDLEKVTRSDEFGKETSFYILQPGSTVATSLCEDEKGQKNCFILKINGTAFEHKTIPLLTVRQMAIDELVLDVYHDRRKIAKSSVRVDNSPDEKLIIDKIDEMLYELKKVKNPRQPNLPLVRLKLIYEDMFAQIIPINPKKFGSRFKDKVANPEDMFFVKVVKPKEVAIPMSTIHGVDEQGNAYKDVSQIVEDYFATADCGDALNVITDKSIGLSLQEYATSDGTLESVNKAFSKSVEDQVNELVKNLTKYSETNSMKSWDIDLNKFEELIEREIDSAKKVRCSQIGPTQSTQIKYEEDMDM